MDEKQVTVSRSARPEYPTTAPFHPDEQYPEYPYANATGQRNEVYLGVREAFHLAGLDQHHYGTTAWNPLQGLITPGETVLLKPNLVKESHPRDPRGWQYTLTHGSVIRAVADYVWKALEGRGTVIVGDGPQTDSDFSTIVRLLGLDEIQSFYRNQELDFRIIDFRQEYWVNRNEVIVSRHKLPGDPNGYIAFDLAGDSEFATHQGDGRYYGADYNAAEVNRHHSSGHHEYKLAATAIACDVLFSLPKLKTHKKAGVTVSLKNLVGINGDKNWLPHHTEGDPSTGGDEHPAPDAKHKVERVFAKGLRQVALRFPGLGPWVMQRARKAGKRVFGDTEKVIRSGNWWGNETTWRMCLDLNKIASYGNLDGTFRDGIPKNRKRHYVLVDGIIAGQGSGPMNPDPYYSGLIIWGLNAPSVDSVSAYLMGFNPERIPIIRQAFWSPSYPLVEWRWQEIEVISNDKQWQSSLCDISPETTFHFEPHFGWKGHIELEAQA